MFRTSAWRGRTLRSSSDHRVGEVTAMLRGPTGRRVTRKSCSRSRRTRNIHAQSQPSIKSKLFPPDRSKRKGAESFFLFFSLPRGYSLRRGKMEKPIQYFPLVSILAKSGYNNDYLVHFLCWHKAINSIFTVLNINLFYLKQGQSLYRTSVDL